MAPDIISTIRADLKQAVDEKTHSNYQRFFKEQVVAYGVTSALVGKIASRYFLEVKPLGNKRIFSLCEELLKSDFEEEAFIAFEWSYRLRKEYEIEDFALFERWLNNYVNNWAKCDTLCNHTVGAFVEKYPQFINNLKQWTRSDNRWVKRAAAVTLIIPAKKGMFLADIFEIADNLLADKDDLVRKGYGWMLKAAATLHRDEVFQYVMKNKSIMPRTALRYAIEKMPAELKRRAME